MKRRGGRITLDTTLIIAPHPDDEILWCHSFLESGDDVTVITVSPTPNQNLTQKAQKKYGFKLVELYFDNCHQHLYLSGILREIEDNIEEHYTNVLIPSGRQHQDHIVSNVISKVVFRPRINRAQNVIEYPYWTYENFEENLIKKTSPYKYSLLMENGLIDWSKYVRTYNRYVAVKNGYNGYYEPFKLIRGVM